MNILAYTSYNNNRPNDLGSRITISLEFKFDLYVPSDSPDMTPYKLSEKGA